MLENERDQQALVEIALAGIVNDSEALLHRPAQYVNIKWAKEAIANLEQLIARSSSLEGILMRRMNDRENDGEHNVYW